MTALQGHRFPHTVAHPLFTIMLMFQQQMEKIKPSNYTLGVVQKKAEEFSHPSQRPKVCHPLLPWLAQL